MIAAVLLVEHIMLRCEHIRTLQHFLRHVDRLALDRVVGAHGVIDEIAALVEAVILHQLLDEVHVPFDLEISIGAVVPAGAAHGQKVTDIIRVITELQPGRDRAQRETAEGPVIPGSFQILI